MHPHAVGDRAVQQVVDPLGELVGLALKPGRSGNVPDGLQLAEAQPELSQALRARSTQSVCSPPAAANR
jgi:hypothetical protein